jgi:GNAT superfamily N-acetyltransferase
MKNAPIDELTSAEARSINDAVAAFNSLRVPFTQSDPFIHYKFAIRTGGQLAGGILATLYCWKCLSIEALIVNEEHRGQGIGSRLLGFVEGEARKMGCTLAHLDTFDFQAKDFYLKRGYEAFGVLDDCPPGHKRFFLKKSL